MMRSPWFIIADDFTGSGDSAVQFRSEGYPARLAIKPEVATLQASRNSAIVVNTDTRYLSPEKSYDSVRTMAEFLARRGARHFYKKIDSTMRGHIEDEVAAVMDGAGFGRALVCPAAPRNGRTVVDGLCLVDGKPIDSPASARDPFTPVNQAKVSAHFERRFSGQIADISLSTVRKGAGELLRAIDEAPGSTRLFLVDAASLADLATIATAADAQDLLLAGSSGLAEAVARRGDSPEAGSGGHSGVVKLPLERIAFVVGSVTATSAAQCARLAESENVLRLVVNGRAAANDPEAEMGRMLDLLRQGPAGKALLIHTDSIEPGATSEGIKAMGSLISRFLGRLALAASRERNLGFLFAMGGDTAARVAAALGADYIDFIDELSPGLPYGYFESNALGARLYFASKSGGFGSADALLDVLARTATKESIA